MLKHRAGDRCETSPTVLINSLKRNHAVVYSLAGLPRGQDRKIDRYQFNQYLGLDSSSLLCTIANSIFPDFEVKSDRYALE